MGAQAGALSGPSENSNKAECAGILAVAKGLSRRECEDTLVHECMHGLFYGHQALRTAVQHHWHNALSDKQRRAWINFLVDLGYNAERDEILALNELLAYMCTEKLLFSESNSNIDEVRSIRDGFIAAIQQHVPVPAPAVGFAGCIWEWVSCEVASSISSGAKGKYSKRK